MLLTGVCRAQPPVILVFGDSLSSAYGLEPANGWVSLLQTRLESLGYSHRVVNASISGETTFGGATRLPAAIGSHHPDLVVIELGGNDGLRGLSLNQTGNNLRRMVATARESGARVLLLGIMLPPNFGRTFTEKFQRIYRDVAEENSLPLVPFLLQGVADRPEWMQPDGIHPNALGQPRILENVWERLLPLLHGQTPPPRERALD